ncbi:unnamed protein product [Amoebophrya sp. A25]|nr:unnamed protein product [Amoebophrya sp. A25]|eukprot:GSA25T00024418001.1
MLRLTTLRNKFRHNPARSYKSTSVQVYQQAQTATARRHVLQDYFEASGNQGVLAAFALPPQRRGLLHKGSVVAHNGSEFFRTATSRSRYFSSATPEDFQHPWSFTTEKSSRVRTATTRSFASFLNSLSRPARIRIDAVTCPLEGIVLRERTISCPEMFLETVRRVLADAQKGARGLFQRPLRVVNCPHYGFTLQPEESWFQSLVNRYEMVDRRSPFLTKCAMGAFVALLGEAVVQFEGTRNSNSKTSVTSSPGGSAGGDCCTDHEPDASPSLESIGGNQFTPTDSTGNTSILLHPTTTPSETPTTRASPSTNSTSSSSFSPTGTIPGSWDPQRLIAMPFINVVWVGGFLQLWVEGMNRLFPAELVHGRPVTRSSAILLKTTLTTLFLNPLYCLLFLTGTGLLLPNMKPLRERIFDEEGALLFQAGFLSTPAIFLCKYYLVPEKLHIPYLCFVNFLWSVFASQISSPAGSKGGQSSKDEERTDADREGALDTTPGIKLYKDTTERRPLQPTPAAER